MDDATLARAQEPFFTTKGVGKGTGLGLSMVHGMMEQSGGRLTLKSRKGDGTTAEILLPMARASVKLSASDAPGPTSHRDSRARALAVVAVDDDPLVLFNTASMLEDLGHKVFEATSASHALEILRRESDVDLVITDQAMPNMTGLELVEAIRTERPHLRAIVASLQKPVDLRCPSHQICADLSSLPQIGPSFVECNPCRKPRFQSS
jgi:CheY-like chemotaxis protein